MLVRENIYEIESHYIVEQIKHKKYNTLIVIPPI